MGSGKDLVLFDVTVMSATCNALRALPSVECVYRPECRRLFSPVAAQAVAGAHRKRYSERHRRDGPGRQRGAGPREEVD
eukprot:6387029-Heterocapsa_arctica.AAC.1